MNQRDRPDAGHVTTAHGPMNDRGVTTVLGAHRVLIASPAVGPIPGPAGHGAGQPLQQGVIGPVSKAETIALHPRLGRGVRIARLVAVGRRVMIVRVMIVRVMIGHSAKERHRVVMGHRVVVGMRRGDRLPGKVPTVDRQREVAVAVATVGVARPTVVPVVIGLSSLQPNGGLLRFVPHGGRVLPSPTLFNRRLGKKITGSTMARSAS